MIGCSYAHMSINLPLTQCSLLPLCVGFPLYLLTSVNIRIERKFFLINACVQERNYARYLCADKYQAYVHNKAFIQFASVYLFR